MLKAVIFDMDGTLLDSEIIHYIVIHEILKRELGYDQSMEEYMKYCGIPDHLMWPMILESLDASHYGRMAEMLDLPLEEIVSETADGCPGADTGEADRGSENGSDRRTQPVLSKKAVADLSETLELLHWHEYDEYIEKNGVRGFPGVRECLSDLRMHRIRLAVATGSLERIVRKNLKLLDIEDLIEEIVTSEDCEKGKPDPDIFLLAAERLGVEPGECLVVEDSRNGLIAAERAGMSRVGFNGAEMTTDMEIAPFVFSDYREVNPNRFYLWHIRSQKD
jgi:HAD superfamily hydrolase (TIGR01509 family)